MTAKNTQLKTWTVKVETLVQFVAYAEVEASSAEEAAQLALDSELDFEKDINVSDNYIFSVIDENENEVAFDDAKAAGHEVFQRVDVRGLESLPEGALNGIYANRC